MFIFLFLALFFLCWGSFLNVVAFRSVTDRPFFTKRSKCPYCNKIIAWYNNIPIISYLFLKGKCWHCRMPISLLYPFVEALTLIIMTGLYLKELSPFSFFSYFIFFSALIVATRTDLQALVIPQIFSIWLVPIGFIFAYFNLLIIELTQSLMGAILGYGALWIIAKLFKYFAKKDGLGIGDMELLAMIGAFLGPLGIWFSLLIGSLSGLIIGGIYLFVTNSDIDVKIPFGPFLALGATIYFFFESNLIYFWLN